MKKKFILSVLLCLGLCLDYDASAGDFSPVKDEKLFMQHYKSASGEIKTLEADFTQEKEIVLLTNKLISHGRMIFRNDNRLKIEYLKPNIFIFSMQSGKVTIKDGDRAASSISTKNNKLFEQISQITLHAINGKIFDSKDFNSTVLEDETSYLIVLIPKSKELKQYYKELDLYIGKKTFLIEKMAMKEVSGDESVMNFKNIKINNEIPDEAFIVD
ncbi:MAG: outer membrane lipoprotein carrier protein LolA [Prevotellaceae bacterium]|jgi:outer membrane lipoprotein-sorting protein|nr:outer membrane lipoprotein carrier protein LolA [Prevotellaceae bacterium]